MQKLLGRILLIAALATLIYGCEEQPGNYALIRPNPAQGPGGGEVNDVTSPVGTNAIPSGDQTASAFPITAKPG